MKILISGGGIGGLTAALCFLHHGTEVTVLEQAQELGEVGAGIQIPPNAMKVFAALGLDAALAETAFRPLAIEARMGRSGLELFHIPLAENAVNAGARHICIFTAPITLQCWQQHCARKARMRFSWVARLRATAKPKTRLRCGWPTGGEYPAMR